MTRSALALLLLALSGCAAVGPDRAPPETPPPTHWRAGAAAPAPDAAILAQWWRQFGDPVLDGLVADALAANTDLASARAKLRETRARRDLARAGLGPTLTGSGSAGRTWTDSATGNRFDAGLDASWEPDLFGAGRRGLEAAEADLAASAEGLRDTRVSLVAEVAGNYLDLRAGERRLAIAEASLAAQTETWRLTRWRHQAGLVSELDEAQALTSLEQTRAGLPSLRTAVAGARNRLAGLLGQAPGELDARLAATGTQPIAADAAVLGIPADTLRHRPDVRAAERRLAAQAARLGEAEAARYPSFKLTGSLGLDAASLAKLFTGEALAGSLLAGITAPIFDSGRIESAIAIQDALLEQARLAYRAAVLAALEDVENALAGLAHARQRRDELARAAASAGASLAIARDRYSAGLADFQAVLDGQRSQLNLDDQLASANADLGNAQIRLFKALGGGWSPEIKEQP
jgi:NodT family efflux transporter outer membrane factor (OMF) lipoprotein